MVREVWTRMTNKAAQDLLQGRANLGECYQRALVQTAFIANPIVTTQAMMGLGENLSAFLVLVSVLVNSGFTEEWFTEKIMFVVGM